MPKISAYTEQTDPDNNDYFVMVRASTTFKMKRATVLEFTPTTPGDWGSPEPTSIQQALDILAASTTSPVIADGDYGDIVITTGVWRFDSSIDFTGKQLNHGTWDDAVIQNSVLTSTNVGPTNPIEAKDSIFYLKDDGDLTKIAQFQCSGIATATTRTFTFPDASGTIALTSDLTGSGVKPTESLIIACSDETTAITTGTAKITFRMPYAFTLSAVRASVTTAPTGSTIIIDINESGSTILSTKLSIDISEKTSTTAASAAVISDSSLADDAEMTIDFDQVGSTIAGAGVKVYLIGTRT